MKSGIALKSVLPLSASVLALAAVANPAFADSPNIKGSYAFTGSASCLVAPGHFDAPTPVPNPNPGVALPNSGFSSTLQPNDAVPGGTQSSFPRFFSVQGIRTFDGQGHGHVNGTGVGHDARPTPGPTGYPHFPPSASSGNFSYDFIYTVDGNGGWTSTMVAGTFTETVTSGPRTGQTITVDAIPQFTGAILDNGKVLIASHAATSVETRTFSNGPIVAGQPTAGDVWPEICQRSRTFIQLPDSNNGQ